MLELALLAAALLWSSIVDTLSFPSAVPAPGAILDGDPTAVEGAAVEGDDNGTPEETEDAGDIAAADDADVADDDDADDVDADDGPPPIWETDVAELTL